MVQGKKKVILGVIVLVVLLLGGFIIGKTMLGQDGGQLNEKICDYCKNNDSVKLSDLTEFDWDVAYVDYEYYESGKELKSKYQIKGEFEELASDNLFRIAFCKDGELVYDMILNKEDIQIDSQIESISEETVLSVKWQAADTGKETIYLSSI